MGVLIITTLCVVAYGALLGYIFNIQTICDKEIAEFRAERKRLLQELKELNSKNTKNYKGN